MDLTNIWDSVKSALVGVYPKLRFYDIIAPENTGEYNVKTTPRDIIRYSRWFPMLLLVPGKTWDSAMAHLGPDNPISIREGVQIYNAEWIGDGGIQKEGKYGFKYQAKYDIRKPADFAKWLQASLNDPAFKQQQTAPVTPIVKASPAPIVRAPVAPPAAASSSASAPLAPITSRVTRQSTSGPSLGGPGSDVCRLRIIARPSRH